MVVPLRGEHKRSALKRDQLAQAVSPIMRLRAQSPQHNNNQIHTDYTKPPNTKKTSPQPTTTKECLDASPNPSAPKVSQLIDLGSIGLNFSPSILKQVYQVFESNYPETLNHFIIYPVNRFVAAGIYGVLSFINEKTRKKFIVTDRIEVVCEHLGLREDEVGQDLGEFMRTKSAGEEKCK